ncbi:MAG TPA: hypothetical protein VGN76_09360 [Gemmatimonadales bacterium]|jgi:hypothetical protein|nr:hypothetical protein [Gemmatimonadales bacterium]
MHLDEEQVQRLLHGEPVTAGMPARDHLAVCAECRARLEEAERDEGWVFDRLRRLDHGVPAIGMDRVKSASAKGVPAWGRLAAGIFLALAVAGVAYAAPGSPLPRMLSSLIHLIAGSSERPPSPEPLPPGGQREESQAGIAVAPGDRLTVVFLGDQGGSTARVSLTDGADLMVRAVGGITTFTSDADRLTVAHEGSPASFEVLVPRAAPLVELLSGGRRRLIKQGTGIVADVPPDSQGHYLIPLSRPAP